jgi:hypothetical protein
LGAVFRVEQPRRLPAPKPTLSGASARHSLAREIIDAGRQAGVMRITIDEETRQVHVSQGAMLLTLQLARAKTPAELEAAAEGIRVALRDAQAVVVNGEAIRL